MRSPPVFPLPVLPHGRAGSSERRLLLLLVGLVVVSLALSSLRLRNASSSLRPNGTPHAQATLFHGIWRPQAHAHGPDRDGDRIDRHGAESWGRQCSPRTLSARAVQYELPHRFYETLRSLDPPFAAPVLIPKHAYMCDPGGDREWSYCLPITGRHDLPYCSAADRMDLLVNQTPATLCYSSVLHMLLVDVYLELHKHGMQPALLFGSMLGAVRNESLIPFTEDVDLGYRYAPNFPMHTVKQALLNKGYHLFRQNVLRVCVAPNHPLAGNLYDPRRDSERVTCHVPYIDVYKMQLAENRMEWEVEETRKHRRVPLHKFEPYTQVRVNDMLFDTLADPMDFLEHEYGPQWRTPKKRGAYRVMDPGEEDDLPEAAMPQMPDGEFDSAVEFDMPDIGEEVDEDGEEEDLGGIEDVKYA